MQTMTAELAKQQTSPQCHCSLSAPCNHQLMAEAQATIQAANTCL